VDGLERALDANREEIERELSKAEAELGQLQGREEAVRSTIRRARVALGLEPTVTPEAVVSQVGVAEGMALHDAIVRVLRAERNRPMAARELSDEVNRLKLYRRRDGAPVDASQIHARVHAYSRLFERAGGRIRLRQDLERDVDGTLLGRFDDAMLEVYDAAMREVGYSARRFLFMTRRRGGLDAAQHLLAKHGVSEGFLRLAEARKLSVSMEFQVLRLEFKDLFSDQEREIARRRLLDHGFLERDLP
jgi:hypothetical protein